LADLQAARALVAGATVNDVVLSVCSDALRRYLQYHGELPDSSLVAWVPINARARSDADSGSSGNRISAMTTPIFTDEADTVERLRRISLSTRRSKEARAGIPARLMTDLTQHMPSATQVLASRLVLQTGLAARLCNVFVSNVPGPQVPLYMNGARVLRNFGLAPLADGMGLFIATPSYDGQISFNVISTREILPDIDRLMDCFDAALQALQQARESAAGKRAKRTAGARRAKASPKRRQPPASSRKASPVRPRAARKRQKSD
ncbi:MAG: WS/DGAT domain-containing protein, partial [Chromatocurvus sp.]